jgi:uridine kinase
MGRSYRESSRVIAICGGSGSGKTTAARFLRQILGEDRSAILAQDSYYFDQRDRFDGDGGSVNFDHPDSLDFALLAEHLGQLRNGDAVEVPQYDFVTHARMQGAVRLDPVPFVLVDGTLLLSQRHLRPHFTEAVFIEASEAVRFSRRLERDTRERGRQPDGVRRQFELQVKPMHDLFVEPSKRHASHLIQNDDASPLHLAAVLRTLLREHAA